MSDHGTAEARDTIYLAGGIALAIFGAGLILSHGGIRRMVADRLGASLHDGENPLSASLAGVLPDVERYLRIRSL